VTVHVLVVCTANQCRSPMAAALLARRLPDVVVTSAGSHVEGVPVSGGSVRAMAARGLDISGHRSRRLASRMIDEADLIIGMARSHVREVALSSPGAIRRTFTLRELVRRGEAAGPAGDLGRWLERLNEDRSPIDLLGDDPRDDIEDPIGRPDAAYEVTARALDDLVERLARLLETVGSRAMDR